MLSRQKGRVCDATGRSYRGLDPEGAWAAAVPVWSQKKGCIGRLPQRARTSMTIINLIWYWYWLIYRDNYFSLGFDPSIRTDCALCTWPIFDSGLQPSMARYAK